ncbi:MAG: response regulator transcription factor [Ferruginibacter sp.]
MIRLAIIEDNRVYLNALEAYLNKIPDIELVHLAGNLQSMPLLIVVKPDVVIMDIDLGTESGIKGVQEIKKALPGTGIFMLTVFDDEEKIVQSIQAGAAGYLLKKDSPKKIVEAIRNIYKGEASINSQVALTLINAFPKSSGYTPDFNKYNLTKRETEIVLLLIEGLSYKQIPSRSFISMATLNTHIRNIYDKLDLHSRAEIAAKFRS